MDRRPGDPPRREVVVHVDAAVLADDTAAGRAHFEGGPAITGAQARRMLCEATAVVMLEQGREPLAVGRRRRRATKAQRRALLRRDGGCARPGCPETRIERLHAHHMRHWLFGGRTDLANLVLLCDADHGLVHDHDLVLSRRDGRLIVLTPDGRHIWGTADAAFTHRAARRRQPPDRRPRRQHGPVRRRPPHRHRRRPAPHRRTAARPRRREAAPPPGRPLRRRRARRPPRRSGAATGAPPDRPRPPAGPAPGQPALRSPRASGSLAGSTESARLSRVLFPDGEPTLADSLQEHYDRLDLRFAIGVLMGNRDLVRRLAAEAGVPVTG